MKLIPIEWTENNLLKILDQRLLPEKKDYIICKNREDVFHAIKTLAIRGAPLIGIAAAYGLFLDVFINQNLDIKNLKNRLIETGKYLKSSRPTAVNLFWAIDRMLNFVKELNCVTVSEFLKLLLQEAKKIHEEDSNMCNKIGEYGEVLIKNNMGVLTHCNAGSLATGGIGTALAVIYKAWQNGKKFKVYADETRPLLQGARLTVFELLENGIDDTTLICDNMAGFLMKKRKINIVITGADRIARNGDTANKIGTFSVAKLASTFNIPFYIAAPFSTFDFNAESEKDIPIEERNKEEIINGMGKQTAPLNVKVYNPAFDVTDNELITGIITEKGIIYPPYRENIEKYLQL